MSQTQGIGYCPTCGKPIFAQHTFYSCTECGKSLPEEIRANLPKLVLASLGKRFWGSLIDAAIVTIPIIIIILVIVVTMEPNQNELEQMTIAQQYAIEAAFFFAYWLVFLLFNGYVLYTRGQTIGKVLMRTRIVDLNGNIPQFGRVFFLRYLIPGFAMQIPCIGSIFGLIDCLFIFGAERRCVHDYIAGTKVIDARATLNSFQVLPPSPELLNAGKLAPTEERSSGPEARDSR
jgi:uncharacterized RDD family membrane protein YckC